MRRIAALAAPLLLLAPATAGSGGCSPADCGPGSTLARSAGLLDYRPAGPGGPLLAYDLAAGKVRFRLPSGLLSADGTTFVSAVRASGTTIARYNAHTGRSAGASRLAGRWSVEAVSADGRQAVLRSTGSRTTFRVGARTIALRGDWRAEAVSNDGRRLFLLEYLRDGYRVRWYDLAAGRLLPGSLRDKTEPALMDGVAWSSLATPDGRRLLTLFLTGDGEAAVHSLDLDNPLAVCVDLPGTSFELAQQYGLALAPDGRMLTAVNPALGTVVRIDLARSAVTRTSRFPRYAGPAGTTSASASSDGRVVAFATGSSVWTYDTRSGTVTARAGAGRRGVALAFRPDDRRILVVRADRTSRMLAAG
jgi:WD40 repeat protein